MRRLLTALPARAGGLTLALGIGWAVSAGIAAPAHANEEAPAPAVAPAAVVQPPEEPTATPDEDPPQEPATEQDNASGDLATDRIAGSSRYDTAVEISRTAFPEGADTVYLASGQRYEDTLAAAPAAAQEGGPVLLTRKDSLPGVVREELARLAPERVVVVGGPSVVSTSVLDETTRLVPRIERRGGGDPYATARSVAKGAFDSADEVYVATGRGYEDALSAAASAGASGAPVVLVRGDATAADEQTKALLEELGVKRTVMVGGEDVLSPGIEDSLRAFGAVRAAGSTAYGTSQAVNRELVWKADHAYLATRLDYADALAGAAVAGAQGAPLYLVPQNCVPRGTLADLKGSPVKRVTLLGGPVALTREVGELEECTEGAGPLREDIVTAPQWRPGK